MQTMIKTANEIKITVLKLKIRENRLKKPGVFGINCILQKLSKSISRAVTLIMTALTHLGTAMQTVWEMQRHF